MEDCVLGMCKVLLSNPCVMERREEGRRGGMQGKRGKREGGRERRRVREVTEKKGGE